jgi:hypothetical protein
MTACLKGVDMESSLHRELKNLYCDQLQETEVKLGKYRIDAMNRGRLIEVQCSGLGAIRNKIRVLSQSHRIDVIKPLVARQKITMLDSQDGLPLRQRWSPKRCTPVDMFLELVHFVGAFPQKNLRLIVPVIETEQIRFPGHGRKRRWRKNDFQVQDTQLIQVHQTIRMTKSSDLKKLLPSNLPRIFDTGIVAQKLNVNRWLAQKIAYCFREMGAADIVSKKGNTLVYEIKQGEKAA